MLKNKHAELVSNNGFYISTDKSLLDIEVIHKFLSNESYWNEGISKELVIASIDNSIICYGIYEGNPTIGSPKQVGFARVVSDLVRFSWLGDVFILPEYRGQGLSKWLMSVITEHPNLKGTSFQLATRDAHSLYAQYGFKPLDYVENRMARPLDWDAINDGYKKNK
ncbi:GNAT family N-acetyltransferase [Cytobacillus dafuensis]|uniref:GNAT family N-acetyltransferase n=1 Tax=Cytobacillus dafuensis TaxID=1742359 RepID=A0A5B8Z0J4_CYTDA|nr:GNAT family N-acetyltransferase [Cytobacillus dafuensis]QED46281.1 GNAT family N-acetyltransferase [Cytobacillus dafuensis]